MVEEIDRREVDAAYSGQVVVVPVPLANLGVAVGDRDYCLPS